MPISGQIKRVVALCIVAAWMSLFGVTVAEACGYLQDTPEHTDQTVEHALSTPADQTASLSDHLAGNQQFVGFVKAVMKHDPNADQMACSIVCRVVAHSPPLRHPSELFQLFSVYRL